MSKTRIQERDELRSNRASRVLILLVALTLTVTIFASAQDPEHSDSGAMAERGAEEKRSTSVAEEDASTNLDLFRFVDSAQKITRASFNIGADSFRRASFRFDRPTFPDVDSPNAPAGYWDRPWITGSWGGVRDRWSEKGVDLEFRLTQGYQHVVLGGIRRNGAYSGKFDTHFKFNMEKLAGWKGFSWQVTTETRFGKFPTTAALLPSTGYIITPLKEGEVFAVTALNFSQLIPIDAKKGNFISFGAGKYENMDMVSQPFHGGAGVTTFMHSAFIGTGAATGSIVPTIANGATFAWIRKGSPFITAAVFDANPSLVKPGIKRLFADGVTFVPGVQVPTRFGGKSGNHALSFAVTTKEVVPFAEFPEIILPVPPGTTPVITRKRGSWVATYIFHQYISERRDQGGARTGWGVFGYAQVADKTTNPFAGFAAIGIGGNGIFKNRSRDRFGVAYAYAPLSGEFKDLLRPLIPLRNEQIFEGFYSFALTPFADFTLDLQVIHPTVRASEVAVMPGARLVLKF